MEEKTLEQLREDAIEAVRTCYDPEIPVNIYELGLIYELNITPERNAEIIMTLTSPFCPVAGTLPEEVRQKVKAVVAIRSEEHTSEPQSLMRISYAVFCWKKKKNTITTD